MPPLSRKQAFAVLTACVVLLLIAGMALRRRLSPPPVLPPLPPVGAGSDAPAPEGGSGSPEAPAQASGGTLAPTAGAPEPAPPPPETPAMVVHVTGCVTQPGIVELPRGSRVIDAVQRAGGAKPCANLDAMNLAARLDDGMKIYVPCRLPPGSHRSAGDASPSDQAASVPSAPPAVLPGAPEGSSSAGTVSAGESTSGKITSPAQGRVNINRAGAAELQRLPHIGAGLAQRIIEYRTRYGPFTTVDQLLEVPGIGRKRLEDLRPLVEL